MLLVSHVGGAEALVLPKLGTPRAAEPGALEGEAAEAATTGNTEARRSIYSWVCETTPSPSLLCSMLSNGIARVLRCARLDSICVTAAYPTQKLACCR